MPRISGQRQMDLVVVELAVRRGAEMIFDVARAFDGVGIGRAALEFVEQRAVRLAHHLGQHVEAAAMRHAETTSFTPRLPLRLMTAPAPASAIAPSRPKRLVPVNLTSQNFSKPSASTSLSRIALLPSGVKRFPCPGLRCVPGSRPFARVGDVHEFDAERPAVGALADRDDFASLPYSRPSSGRGRSRGRNRLRKSRRARVEPSRSAAPRCRADRAWR